VSRSLAPERWRRLVEVAGDRSAAEYVRAAARAGIGSKSALIEHAAISRGLATTRWSSTEVVIQVPGDTGPPIFFHEMNGPRTMGGRFYCDEKTVARDLLRRAGLKVAISQAFEPSELLKDRRNFQQHGTARVARRDGFTWRAPLLSLSLEALGRGTLGTCRPTAN
jgi:hypothetical protein